MSERPREIGSPLDERAQAGHVSILWPGRVMAKNADDRSNAAFPFERIGALLEVTRIIKWNVLKVPT